MSTSRIASLRTSARSRRGDVCHAPSARRPLRFESLEDRLLLAADLIATDIGVSDSTVNPGQSITVTWTASNVGNSATGFFPLGTSQQGLMWSTDSSITREHDRLLEKEFLGWLGVGSTTPESHTINIPADATPGTSYWIGVIADYDGDISESNENNNHGGIAAEVVVNHADLDVLSIALDEASDLWYSGDNIDAEVTVKNIGTATANDANVAYYLGTLANRTLHSIGNGQLGGIFPLNDMSPDETATDWIGSPLPGGGWTIPDDVAPGTDYYIWAHATTDIADTNSDNDWDRSAGFSIQSRLSWRDGTAAGATIADTIYAGQMAYARVDGTPGEQFEIEIWEDDGGLDDDKIETFSITVGPGGFATYEWAAAWQGDDADDPQNQYYLSGSSPPLFGQRLATLDVSVQAVPDVNSFTNPLSYDWDDSRPGEGVIDVTLDRLDSGAPIDPALQTWVVIHGRNGAFDEAEDRVKQLADELVITRSQDQVLTLDWSAGAASINLADFSQEAWIVSVAHWAMQALSTYGFESTNVNLVGHSFGGVISGELAAAFAGGVNTVLAIDPAEDPAFIVSGSLYSTDNVVFGGNNSNYSWAFYTPGIAGNEETPTTADEAFVVENSEHSLLVDLVASMLIAPVGEVTRFFSLDRLLALADGPWVRDSFNEDGELGQPNSGYEAVLFTPSEGDNEGIRPTGIDFVNKNPFPVPAPGDYDNDLGVDGADFLDWQRTYGEAGENLPADGNFTGSIDRGDLRIWQHHFGSSPSPAISVPMQTAEFADSSPDATPLANSSLVFELFRSGDDSAQEATIGDSVLEAWFPSAVGQPLFEAEVATRKAEGEFVALSSDGSSDGSSEGEGENDESWLTGELLERVFG